ncbi:MAG: type II toxin-antitoxin system RelE/ParE family toxin [Gemmatimonadota bacterium]
MPKRLIEFHVTAQAELDQAIAYYESRESGLGGQFLSEVRRILSVLTDFPESGTPIWKTRRRLLLDRFPFGLVYRVLDDGSIRVLAVMHLRRRPGYWHRRS